MVDVPQSASDVRRKITPSAQLTTTALNTVPDLAAVTAGVL